MNNITDGVIPAPDWLIERMRRLRELPSPTLEEVEIQFRASERARQEYDAMNMDEVLAEEGWVRNEHGAWPPTGLVQVMSADEAYKFVAARANRQCRRRTRRCLRNSLAFVRAAARRCACTGVKTARMP